MEIQDSILSSEHILKLSLSVSFLKLNDDDDDDDDDDDSDSIKRSTAYLRDVDRTVGSDDVQLIIESNEAGVEGRVGKDVGSSSRIVRTQNKQRASLICSRVPVCNRSFREKYKTTITKSSKEF